MVTVNTNNPVPQVTVFFDSQFSTIRANPSTQSWHVDLDGTDVTGFSPAPAAGVTSTAPLVFNGGMFGHHTLKAMSTCGTFCVYPTEQIDLTIPRLVFNGTITPVTPTGKQFVTEHVIVGVQNAPGVSIAVTVFETTSPFAKVQFGLSPGSLIAPGRPLNVTIPSGSTKGDFFMQGQSLGLYKLSLTAPGTEPGVFGGNIIP